MLHITVFLLCVSQFVSFGYIISLHQQMKPLNEKAFADVLFKNEDDRYKHPVVGAAEEKVYIPEARLAVPLDESTRTLRYDYRSDQSKTTLYLSLTGIVGNQLKKDGHTCDKVAVISQTKDVVLNHVFYKEIPATKDGLRYIYLHNPEGCSIYTSDTHETIKNIVDQLSEY